jgi:M6 family metalloprotease-like protein
MSVQLGLIIFGSSATAATIAGSKCTKVGIKKNSAKITYICSKSGTKLVWKAEIRSKAPITAPVVTPKPTTPPTSAATATPSVPTSESSAGGVLEKPSELISIYTGVVNSGATAAARKSLELPAGVTPAATNSNLKLWIFDPEKKGQALGSPGIYLQKNGGTWYFVGGTLPNGIFTAQLSTGSYLLDVVEPNGDQKKYSRGRYSVQVGSDSTLTFENLLPNSAGYFSVTTTVNTRRASELAKFAPTSPCQIVDQTGSPNMSNAFPRATGRLTNHGVVRALIIPVDFTDLPGNGSPADIYKEMARGTADFYYKQSRKTVRFEFSTLKEYVHLGVPVGQFNLGTYNGGDAGALFSAGIKAADDIVNFSDFDVVYVLPPSTVRMNQIAYGPAFPNNVDANSFMSNEGPILNGSTGGADAWQPLEGAQWKWMAHETGHLYGLFDWYTLDDSNPYGPWDLMSLNWSTEVIEFNAWNRYIQDWLDDSQIQCQLKSELSASKDFTIEAIAADSNQPKAVMVKVSDKKILVIEVRATAGLDKISDQRAGVLIYTVDASIQSIKGMSKVYTTPGSSPDLRDATLQMGEQITVEGVTIKVDSFSKITAKVTLTS